MARGKKIHLIYALLVSSGSSGSKLGLKLFRDAAAAFIESTFACKAISMVSIIVLKRLFASFLQRDATLVAEKNVMLQLTA